MRVPHNSHTQPTPTNKNENTTEDDEGLPADDRRRIEREDAMMKQCREYFKEIDCDGSGCLDVDEFDQMLKKIGVAVQRSDVVRMYNKVDRDGDGEVKDLSLHLQILIP